MHDFRGDLIKPERPDLEREAGNKNRNKQAQNVPGGDDFTNFRN